MNDSDIFSQVPDEQIYRRRRVFAKRPEIDAEHLVNTVLHQNTALYTENQRLRRELRWRDTGDIVVLAFIATILASIFYAYMWL